MNDNKRALSDLGEAIRLDPDFATWRYQRARILLEKANNPKLAIDDLNAALALLPNTAAYITLRDQAYKKIQKPTVEADASPQAAATAQAKPAATDGPFDEKELARSFELSKTCASQCANDAVNMVRLPLPEGKIGFLITTSDQGFCGSGGCSSMVVVVSGARFVKIKEGLGITKAQAVTLASNGEGTPRSTESLECSKQADAQGLQGAERLAFRSQCKANATAQSQPLAPASPSLDGKIIYPNAVSSAYSQEAEGRARMLTCRDQYNANKSLNANGGLQWIAAGGGYYSVCNERLKATSSPSPGTARINPPGPVVQRITTQECAQKYQAAKAAGTLGGRQWNDFRKAECVSDTTPTAAVSPVVQSPNKPPQEEPNSAKAIDVPQPPGGSPKAIIESIWNNLSLVNLSLGSLAVVSGPAGGNQEFACGSGSVGPSAFQVLKAAQTIGLVSVVEDASSQQYRQGQSFSWGQMLDQTTAGVAARVTVVPTAVGRSLDISNTLPVAQRIQNCMRFRQGTFRITQIIKDEPQRKGVTDYRVLFVKYGVSWTPQYKEMMRLVGVSLSESKKGVLLLKDDPFKGRMVLVASDLADDDKDFTTNNVGATLAAAK